MSQPDIRHGDCLDVLRTLPDASVDAIVTDPPYELAFMGRQWDATGIAYNVDLWRECLRVLRPGGHLAAFGGTRTYHRMACAVEDAGFEIRDSLTWVYGSGFPKSLDVGKAIDKARDDRADILTVTSWLADQAVSRGFTRRDLDQHMGTSDMAGWWLSRLRHRCQCPTWEQWDQIKRFMGLPDDMDAEVWRLNGRKGTPGEAWDKREVLGTRHRPLLNSSMYAADAGGGFREDFTVTAPATVAAQTWQGFGTALKPAQEPIVLARRPLSGTVAANVLAHGTGALNIDGTRTTRNTALGVMNDDGWVPTPAAFESHPAGRWPANVLLSHGPDCADVCTPGCPVAELDAQSGTTPSNGRPNRAANLRTHDGGNGETHGAMAGVPGGSHDDTGGASRFFPTFRYQAKAPTRERPKVDGVAHPTVKPLDLMRWLVRLVTPPGGTVLDPFAGSGTTVEAALLEGFRVIAVEREADYLPLIRHRIDRARTHLSARQAIAELADPALFDLPSEEVA